MFVFICAQDVVALEMFSGSSGVYSAFRLMPSWLTVFTSSKSSWYKRKFFLGRSGMTAARYDIALDADSMDFTTVFFGCINCEGCALLDGEIEVT